MAMMDCPWYEVSGPNSNNQTDLGIIKDDLINYMKCINRYNTFKIGDSLYQILIERVIHDKFEGGKSVSWRGYATFKYDLMFELTVDVFNYEIQVNHLKYYVNRYKKDFKKRFYSPPDENSNGGGKGYLMVKETTMVGRSFY